MDDLEFSYLHPSPLSPLADHSSCVSFHLLGRLQDRPPLLLCLSDRLLNVDFAALVCVCVVTQSLASPPQVVYLTVTVRFGAQDGLQTKFEGLRMELRKGHSVN